MFLHTYWISGAAPGRRVLLNGTSARSLEMDLLWGRFTLELLKPFFIVLHDVSSLKTSALGPPIQTKTKSPVPRM